MKKLLFSFACLLLLSTGLSAQTSTLFNKSGLGWSGIWGGWAFDMTGFEDELGVTRGGSVGLEFGKSLLVGYGGFRTTDEIAWGADQSSQFGLKYKGLILGYDVASHNVIHPVFKVLVGGGTAAVEGVGADKVFVLQPSAGLELNVFKIFRLGLDGGYRYVTNTDIPNLQATDLSAFYGEVNFKFILSWGKGR